MTLEPTAAPTNAVGGGLAWMVVVGGNAVTKVVLWNLKTGSLLFRNLYLTHQDQILPRKISFNMTIQIEYGAKCVGYYVTIQKGEIPNTRF